MTLTTHAVIAAAITRPLMRAHPALILLVGIATHYLSDAVPHWDYGVRSLVQKDTQKKRLNWYGGTAKRDFLWIIGDFIVGFSLVYLWVRPHSREEFLWVIFSVAGGMLPDLLQGINLSLKSQPLRPLQKLHDFFHTRIKLGRYPLFGIPFQLAIYALFTWLLVK